MILLGATSACFKNKSVESKIDKQAVQGFEKLDDMILAFGTLHKLLCGLRIGLRGLFDWL